MIKSAEDAGKIVRDVLSKFPLYDASNTVTVQDNGTIGYRTREGCRGGQRISVCI